MATLNFRYPLPKSGTKAVVLAGGLGTRLRPITYLYPKPMVPVRGKPFLEYLICFLKNQGISEFILCLHYMAEKFSEYFGDGSKFGVAIEYSIEEEPLGTAGAIKKVEDYLNSSFLVLNGDTYVDLNPQEMLKNHRENKNVGTVALIEMKDPFRYGVVKLSEDRRITSFSEKVSTAMGYVNAGVYIFEKSILEYIPKNRQVSLEKEVIPHILCKERIYGFITKGYFIDIGVPEDYHRFEREIVKVFHE